MTVIGKLTLEAKKDLVTSEELVSLIEYPPSELNQSRLLFGCSNSPTRTLPNVDGNACKIEGQQSINLELTNSDASRQYVIKSSSSDRNHYFINSLNRRQLIKCLTKQDSNESNKSNEGLLIQESNEKFSKLDVNQDFLSIQESNENLSKVDVNENLKSPLIDKYTRYNFDNALWKYWSSSSVTSGLNSNNELKPYKVPFSSPILFNPSNGEIEIDKAFMTSERLPLSSDYIINPEDFTRINNTWIMQDSFAMKTDNKYHNNFSVESQSVVVESDGTEIISSSRDSGRFYIQDGLIFEKVSKYPKSQSIEAEITKNPSQLLPSQTCRSKFKNSDFLKNTPTTPTKGQPNKKSNQFQSELNKDKSKIKQNKVNKLKTKKRKSSSIYNQNTTNSKSKKPKLSSNCHQNKSKLKSNKRKSDLNCHQDTSRLITNQNESEMFDSSQLLNNPRITKKQQRNSPCKDKFDRIEVKKRSGPRSKVGCWTCRVRHKACPENKPICDQCKRLKLLCDYSNERPDYMTDPILQKEKLKLIRQVTNVQKRINFFKKKSKKSFN